MLIAPRIDRRGERDDQPGPPRPHLGHELPRVLVDFVSTPADPRRVGVVVGRLTSAVLVGEHGAGVVVVPHRDVRPDDPVVELHAVEVVVVDRFQNQVRQEPAAFRVQRVQPDKAVGGVGLAPDVPAQPLRLHPAKVRVGALVSGHEPVLEPGDVDQAVPVGGLERFADQVAPGLQGPAGLVRRILLHQRGPAVNADHTLEHLRRVLRVPVLPALNVDGVDADLAEPSHGLRGALRRRDRIVGRGRQPGAAELGWRSAGHRRQDGQRREDCAEQPTWRGPASVHGLPRNRAEALAFGVRSRTLRLD